MFRPAQWQEIRSIKEEVASRLDLAAELTDTEVRAAIVEVVMERSRHQYMELKRKKDLIEAVFNAMRRLDVLQPLMEDSSVTDIMVNSYDEVFIEQDGVTRRVDICFESSERLENIIQTIVARVNRVVNESSPIVDARLPDGSRVSVVLPPVALKGPTLTIRKFPEQPMTMNRLLALGTLSREAAHLLNQLVQARYNIFISGGTGSGKTTFLNVLSEFIPAHERVITIEDSAELQLTRVANLVRLETRNANTEGKGEITMRDLIRASLRMRPDRIIVGEVRGPEALDMLQAMNTGHDGSLSTGHANTPRDMLNRLETMVLSGSTLPVQVVRRQIASALDIIIHLGRLRDGSRRVLEIVELDGCDDQGITLRTLYRFVETNSTRDRVSGELRAVNTLKNTLKLIRAGISPGGENREDYLAELGTEQEQGTGKGGLNRAS